MVRLRHKKSRNRANRLITGFTPRLGDEPIKKPKRRKSIIDRDAMAEALAKMDEQAAKLAETRKMPPGAGGNTTLLPIGICHECGKSVTGQRRFCGSCLSKHDM